MSIILLSLTAICFIELPIWIKVFIGIALGYDLAVAFQKASNK